MFGTGCFMPGLYSFDERAVENLFFDSLLLF